MMETDVWISDLPPNWGEVGLPHIMRKRDRTIIFIVCFVVFALAAPAAILYSQGYRIDFNNKKIVQTGGFYFKAWPGRAEVYLNGKFEKNTAMITNAVFIINLLPKNYEIEIRKNGYRPWVKNLAIMEKEVTEAKNIVLFPENPQFTAIKQMPSKIISSATSTDGNKIWESNNYEIWIVLPEKNEKVFLTRFSEKIENIFWLNDYYLIFNVGNKIKIAEIDNGDGLNIIDLAEFSAQGGENPKIYWDKDARKLYVLSEKKTYLLENLLP